MIKLLDNKLRQIIEPFHYRFVILPGIASRQKQILKKIRVNQEVKIAFILSSLSMWRIQFLYDILKQDIRFHLILVLYPFPTFSEEQRGLAINQLLDYCEKREMPYLNLSLKDNPGQIIRNSFDPDIIFYPQPYNNLYSNDLDSQFFADKLICYVPYAMPTSKETWTYHNYLNNIAWRLYYQSKAHKEEASEVLYNNGRNIRVVGEPIADMFSSPIKLDPWKKQDHPKKRVIWAPHYSLVNEGYLHRDSFIGLSETMWKIAGQFKDRIQFAFKPHPRLASALYNLPGWGESRTVEYYQQWAEGDNTQLELGNYIDLFKTSDAMVHDCSSFSVEYHYIGNPVLFTTDNIIDVTDKLNEFGRDAIFAHYQGKTADDVVSFLKNVVLGGEDPMFEIRKEFRKKYLLSYAGESVADNIYQDLLVSLGFGE